MTVTLTARTVTGRTVTVRDLPDVDAAVEHAAEHTLRILTVVDDDTAPATPPKRGRRKAQPDDPDA